MKVKAWIKLIVDLCMALALLLLMTYSLIGEAAHEWIGIGMLLLVISHHILNAKWHSGLRKGCYNAIRVFRLVMDLLIILCILGSMVSGIMLSRHALHFLPERGGASFARTLHMLSAYWGFVLMAIHVGLHAGSLAAAIKKKRQLSGTTKTGTIFLRMFTVLLCIYAVYAFVRRDIGSYLFLQTAFVFLDFSEPLVYFLLDYIAIMALFICGGHCTTVLLKKINSRGET